MRLALKPYQVSQMIPGSEFIIIKMLRMLLSRAPDDYRRILEVFLDEVEDKQLLELHESMLLYFY